jgi:hypothetical protein
LIHPNKIKGIILKIVKIEYIENIGVLVIQACFLPAKLFLQEAAGLGVQENGYGHRQEY